MSRLVDLFVGPSAAGVAETTLVRIAERAAPRALAVVCATRSAAVAGAAIGLGAARAGGEGVAVVCSWTGADDAPSRGGAATGAARRLAARLSGRDLLAAAGGRLVRVALPADPAAAIATAGRAAAASGAVPVVVVLAGARPPCFDALLAGQDRVIVVPEPDAPEGLEALAVADAARVGRATGVLRLGAATPARLVAVSGWALTAGLRGAVGAALEGHGS